MPGTPQPVGEGPGGIPIIWNTVQQTLQALDQRLSALEGARQPNVLDGFGNTQVVIGQLLQTVTIGASNTGTANPGVRVQTVLTAPPSPQPLVGIAVQQGIVTTTITTTAGSATATVASGAGMVNGMVIGAATVNDPTSGTATPAITPGTTISSGGGTTSITLSQPAAETGSGLFCASCQWRSLAGFTYP